MGDAADLGCNSNSLRDCCLFYKVTTKLHQYGWETETEEGKRELTLTVRPDLTVIRSLRCPLAMLLIVGEPGGAMLRQSCSS